MGRWTVRILAFAAAVMLIAQLVGVAALARYREQVSEAFAVSVPPPPPVPEVERIDNPTDVELADFQDAIELVGAALEKEDGSEAARYFDTGRMLDEIVRTGIRKAPAANDRPIVLRTIQQAVDRSLIASPLRWDRASIRRVRFLNDDHTEAMVFTRLRGTRGTRHKVRWWLRRGVHGWHFYDVEDLRLGLRLSLATGPVTQASKAGERDALMKLSNAARLLRNGHVEDAERTAMLVDHEPLSGPGEAYRLRFKAHLALAKGNPGDALDLIDRADGTQPHPYSDVVRATAFNAAGEHEKALKRGRHAIQLCGDDAHAHRQIGLAAEKLGRRDEALEAYRAGLQEEPALAANLHGLRALLPAGQKAEVGEWLAKLPTAGVEFTPLVTEAFNDGDEESVQALVDAYRKMSPDDVALDFVKVRLNIRRKKVNIAAAQFKVAIQKVNNLEVQKQQTLLFLDDMLAINKSVEAYRVSPDPTLAFVYMAGKLEGKADRAEELRRLVAEHDRRQPKEP
jgi:tetratricopeptide (TPR) repeat protein